MKSFIHKAIFAVSILVPLMLTSCIKDDEETVTVVTYSDSSITAFSLGTLSYAPNGTASTYSGAGYEFTIDQDNHTIENNDSLLKTTDASSIPCNITTLNSGYPFKQMPDGSYEYFTSGDTLDFSQGSRKIQVYSTDGTSQTVYTITINIHKEVWSSMTWDSNNPYQRETLNDSLRHIADSMLAEKELFLDKYKPIGISHGNEYALDKETDSLFIINREEAKATKELILAGTPLPHSIISLTAAPNGKDATIITAKDSTGRNIVLYKAEIDGEQWMPLYNDYGVTVPDNEEMLTITYGNYLLALTNKQEDAKISHNFYVSEDFGRTWKQRYFFTVTDAFANQKKEDKAEKVTRFAKDSKNHLWIFTDKGNIYRGKQNSIAWN